MARTRKAIKRPAQGVNSAKKWPVRQAAGGDNVRTSGGAPAVSSNRKRGYAS